MEPVAGNPYAWAREHVLHEHAEHLRGSRSGLFCAVSAHRASEPVRDALSKTAGALGYGEDGVTWVALDADGGGTALAGAQLHELLEGLDPIAIVTCDDASTAALSEAYRTLVEPLAQASAGCRDVRAFGNLDALLQADAGKQRAWSLLKTLPKL